MGGNTVNNSDLPSGDGVRGGFRDVVLGDPAAATRAPRALDINTATRVELETLPGIGAAIADRIIANRPFTTVGELATRVDGIGPETLARIALYIIVTGQ